MKALVDVAALWALIWILWHGSLSLIRIVFGRFDGPPAPVGVHEMVADHPEREVVELSDHERDVLLVLDALTKWEDA